MTSSLSKGQNALVIPRKERIAESKEVNKEGSARKNKGKWAAGRRKERRGPKEKRGANERGKLRGFSKAQREKEESKEEVKRENGERVVQHQRGSGGVGGTS